MSKKGKNRTFWRNIKFKYRVTITNLNTLENVTQFQVSRLNGFSLLFSALFLLFAASAALIAFTPLRNYLPGYMNTEVRRLIVENALYTDSLASIVEKQNLYILNIQDIFSGTVRIDTVHSLDSLNVLREDTLLERSRREEEFRRQYEENERYNLTTTNQEPDTDGLVFYRPTRGLISSQFNTEQRHFGIDIAATPNESVLSTLDGTVILSAYTAETGYVIQVQHSRDLLSVYKHCGSLLKREGDPVRAGEAIALVGNTGTQTTGPHLHFEIWHKGKPINPERFIVF
ncbi:MAG: M23 family metallopeptidase [Bacteroides sp.]|nr:M23 family metallopeptidase [Bacteroides sp.]